MRVRWRCVRATRRCIRRAEWRCGPRCSPPARVIVVIKCDGDVVDLIAAVQRRRAAYRQWHDETLDMRIERQRWIDQHLSRERSRDQGLDYGLEL